MGAKGAADAPKDKKSKKKAEDSSDDEWVVSKPVASKNKAPAKKIG